jgi:type I site-specific restriction endonuclease
LHTSSTRKHSTNLSFKPGLTKQVSCRGRRSFNDLTLMRICVASDRKSTIVFAVNVAHVRELTRTFQSAGVDARYLYAGTPISERNALIDGFKAGAFPVLINCGSCSGLIHLGHLSPFPFICTALLTEGTDIPNIDCVVIARPTRSRNVFLQMVNRQCIVFPFLYLLNKPTDWSRNEVVSKHREARLSRY